MEPDDLRIERGHPLRAGADALLRPIPCREVHAAPWLEAYFDAVGPSVVEALEEQLPLRVGNVAVTGGGTSKFARIVHLPVQSAPGVPTTLQNLRVAIRSGLVAVDEEGVDAVVLPCPVPPDQTDVLDVSAAAETLLEDVLQYPPVHFERVRLVSRNATWVECLREEFSTR